MWIIVMGISTFLKQNVLHAELFHDIYSYLSDFFVSVDQY